MAAQNLSYDRQFRYIIFWFSEFSELQRDDFLPILLEYLTQNPNENGNDTINMNGLTNAVSNVCITNKPMSLFQCRIKLFCEWNVKWPLDFKEKLKEKIIEIDPTVGEKIMNEMKAHNGNGISNGSSVEVGVDETQTTTVTGMVNDDIVNAAVAIVNATEEAIISDNRLASMLNETSVDDYDNDNEVENGIDAQINAANVIEPTEQVQTYAVQSQEQEHTTVVSSQTLLNNSAEVPLVA